MAARVSPVLLMIRSTVSLWKRYSKYVMEVTDVSVAGYAEVPIHMLKMNFVTKKVANTGIEASRSAVKMIINKVFKTLEEDQMARLADYLEGLFITAPQR